MTRAYYNEHDKFAAEWLRMLILNGEIADGDVDTRSIEDVLPGDLIGYTQCHFFAGIGGWSRALRLAGWPDSRPIWTASCPCQPFSAAGKGNGFADERHLWPAQFWLLINSRPVAIIGEQVASKPGLAWLDIVQSDLESAGYSRGAVDICAAGIGAPHIRQRLYWGAYSECRPAERRGLDLGTTAIRAQRETWERERLWINSGSGSESGNSSDSASSRCDRTQQQSESDPRDDSRLRLPGSDREISNSSDSMLNGWEQRRSFEGIGQTERECASRHSNNSERAGLERLSGDERGPGWLSRRETRSIAASGATRGFWDDADWWHGRDEKYRPIEPGLFPLAHGISGRVGKLRGYGNAIIPPLAAKFIEAFAELA